MIKFQGSPVTGTSSEEPRLKMPDPVVGCRELHAHDPHSEAKAGDDPHQELEPESDPSGLIIQCALSEVQVARCKGAELKGAGLGLRFGAGMGAGCRIYG